MEEDYPEELN